jgi:hypothetical protein
MARYTKNNPSSPKGGNTTMRAIMEMPTMPHKIGLKLAIFAILSFIGNKVKV